MSAAKPKLLIVDDENSLRTSLSAILSRSGYDVRSAHDGFSALAEVRRDCPDLILSDLNMPGMSGFELLSVVRRLCPQVRVVAMSGAFHGVQVPQGVSADAFYAKGTSLTALLETLAELAALDRAAVKERPDFAPQWISLHCKAFEEVCSVTLSCPQCLRTFSLALDVSVHLIREAQCAHCAAPVYYAIVESQLPHTSARVMERSGAATM
jgi:CheY-like chemotaxis protein